MCVDQIISWPQTYSSMPKSLRCVLKKTHGWMNYFINCFTVSTTFGGVVDTTDDDKSKNHSKPQWCHRNVQRQKGGARVKTLSTEYYFSSNKTWETGWSNNRIGLYKEYYLVLSLLFYSTYICCAARWYTSSSLFISVPYFVQIPVKVKRRDCQCIDVQKHRLW